MFQCLKVQFTAEESIELLKQRMSRRPKFNLRDTFKYMDCFDEGKLTRDSFKKILQNNKFYATEAEISWIMDRFDKRKNGKIMYEDFSDEIMPKNSLTA